MLLFFKPFAAPGWQATRPSKKFRFFSRVKATGIVSMYLSVTCNAERPPPPPSEKFAGRSRSDLKNISILLGFLDLENFYQLHQRADIGLYPHPSVLGGNKCQICPLVTLDFSIFEQIWLA